MQCAGAAGTPLVDQQDVTILAKRRELPGVYLGRANRVFAWAAHQYSDRVPTRLAARCGDHGHPAAGRLWNTGKFARGKLNCTKGLGWARGASESCAVRGTHQLGRHDRRQRQKQPNLRGPLRLIGFVLEFHTG
jgi:hypothetical protein